MRLVCISDTHGAHNQLRGFFELPPGDVLIHAGDLTNDGTIDEAESFGMWLAQQPYKHKVVVAGNHDRCFEHDPVQARAALGNCIYLQDSGCQLEGLQFWGSPWISKEYPTARAFLIDRFQPSAVPPVPFPPKRVDVLVTHSAFVAYRRGCGNVEPKVRLHVYGHGSGEDGLKTKLSRCVQLQVETWGRDRSPMLSDGFATVVEIDRRTVKMVRTELMHRFYSCPSDPDDLFAPEDLRGIVRERARLDGKIQAVEEHHVHVRALDLRQPTLPPGEFALPRSIFPEPVVSDDWFSCWIGRRDDHSGRVTIWIGDERDRFRTTELEAGERT